MEDRNPQEMLKTHRSTLMRVVQWKDSTTDYAKLCDWVFLNQWISQLQEENKEPLTIRTYLGSIQYFLSFCEMTAKKDFDGDKITNTNLRIKKWKSVLWKQARKKQHKKDSITMEKFPSPQEIRKLDQSKIITEAQSLLKMATLQDNKDGFSMRNLCLVRDYICLYLILNNGSRPGAVANIIIIINSLFKVGNLQVKVMYKIK